MMVTKDREILPVLTNMIKKKKKKKKLRTWSTQKIFGRNYAGAPVLWPRNVKCQRIGKDSDAGKD